MKEYLPISQFLLLEQKCQTFDYKGAHMLEDRQPCQKKILASVLGPQLRFQKNLIGLLVYPQQTTFLYGDCIRCPQSPLTYHLPKALPSFQDFNDSPQFKKGLGNSGCFLTETIFGERRGVFKRLYFLLLWKSKLYRALNDHEAVRGRFLEAVDVLPLFEGEVFYSLRQLSKQAVVIGESFEEGLALQKRSYFVVDFGGAVLGGERKIGDKRSPSILFCSDFLGLYFICHGIIQVGVVILIKWQFE